MSSILEVLHLLHTFFALGWSFRIASLAAYSNHRSLSIAERVYVARQRCPRPKAPWRFNGPGIALAGVKGPEGRVFVGEALTPGEALVPMETPSYFGVLPQTRAPDSGRGWLSVR
ncbi:hypothetical protein K438DRAFT_1840338 [Mycena galopus ATCC 62051]|nr:hypothetical protein K438DRAFT_1840338 [Mycena galopus ATCC 62051]